MSSKYVFQKGMRCLAKRDFEWVNVVESSDLLEIVTIMHKEVREAKRNIFVRIIERPKPKEIILFSSFATRVLRKALRDNS